LINNVFPKKIAIIFLEEKRNYASFGLDYLHSFFKKSKPKGKDKNPKLNFDQRTCSYLVLQLNSIQSIFEFNIINVDFNKLSLPSTTELKKYDKGDCKEERDERKKILSHYMMNWFYDSLKKCNYDSGKSIREKYDEITCWIGITSEPIKEDYFSSIWRPDPKFNEKNTFVLITTDEWEKSFSPPSLFEYVLFGVLKNALISLSCDLECALEYHWETKGCIFDRSDWKYERKFAVSSPNLCNKCKEQITKLDEKLDQYSKQNPSLSETISKVFNKKWLGKPDERNTILFNLKKDFKYDIDRNSGLYKTILEKFSDSVINNLPQWVIGTIITVSITGLLILLGVKN